MIILSIALHLGKRPLDWLKPLQRLKNKSIVLRQVRKNNEEAIEHNMKVEYTSQEETLQICLLRLNEL